MSISHWFFHSTNQKFWIEKKMDTLKDDKILSLKIAMKE